jgi:hypothetical protein
MERAGELIYDGGSPQRGNALQGRLSADCARADSSRRRASRGPFFHVSLHLAVVRARRADVHCVAIASTVAGGGDRVGRLASFARHRRECLAVKAKNAYNDRLTLWEHADPGIPLVEQARAELRKLP